MTSFKDTNGAEWVIRLRVAEVEDLLEVGIDISKKEDLDRLAGDNRTFLTALIVVLREQLEARGIEPREFKKAMDGDVLEAAGEALWEAVAFFFPNLRQVTKTLLPAIQERKKKAEDRANQLAQEVVARIRSGELDDQLGLSVSSNIATASAASSALTPDPSPGGSSSG
ncbi:MAG TPA: hypothetical protein VKS79_21195 [Gemmataceae bacterium]|nr:hypothetical protein [Gemmataceae bacterium]